jgi:hypothetical protein
MLFEVQFDAVRPEAAHRGRAHPGHALEGGLRRVEIHREEIARNDAARRVFDLRPRDLVERRRHHQLPERKHRQALQCHGGGPRQQHATAQQQQIGEQVDQHRPIPEAIRAPAPFRSLLRFLPADMPSALATMGLREQLDAPVAGTGSRPTLPPSAPASGRSCRARYSLRGRTCAPQHRASGPCDPSRDRRARRRRAAPDRCISRSRSSPRPLGMRYSVSSRRYLAS